MFFALSREANKIGNMDVSKTCDHIKIKIKMPNPSQEPPASSKAPNEDLKYIEVLCTFKINIESNNFDLGCINHHIKIMNKLPNTIQEYSASSKAPIKTFFRDILNLSQTLLSLVNLSLYV